MTTAIVTRTTCLFALILVPLTLFGAAARGQSPAWRSDYSAARNEATEKNRPLVVDVVTENCFWCKKLDSITFRDPSIIAVLNDRFVPLKIDANREPALAAQLQIRSYPTLIIAENDGRILSFIEGYVDGPKLAEHLSKALAPKAVAAPDRTAHGFPDAEKAIAAGDIARAIALLKTISEEKKDLPLKANARKALRELEKQADTRLASARKMEELGHTLEAIDNLGDLMRDYAGTPAATEARVLVVALAARPEVRERQRSRRARELMAQARDEFRTEQFHGCLEKCELITANFPDLPESLEASRLAANINANPEWLANACRNLDERLSAMYLTLAESWLKKGKSYEATACLEKVRRLFPDSPNAQVAQLRLAQIQGRSDQRTDFKKSP